MDNNKLLYSEITEILDGINSQVNILKERQDHPEIEIDILLSDIRNLYSFVKKIDKSPSIEKPSQNIPKKEENPAIIPEVKSNVVSTPEITPLFNEELIEKPAEKIKEDFSLSFPEDTHVKSEETKPNPTSIADRYQGEPSLHEKIGKKDERSIADQIKKPISDLKTGIGLNEKFLFINKLYKGKADAFDKDITYINSLTGAEEAKKYLKENSWTTYQWSDNDEVLENYLNLIERRFLN